MFKKHADDLEAFMEGDDMLEQANEVQVTGVGCTEQVIGSLMVPAQGSSGAGGEAGQPSQVLESARGNRGGQVRRDVSLQKGISADIYF
jgi:hypothetical protein